ncbi:MAG: amidohydrolase, partial [Sphingopyxis sp.]|nr:amidohydrolase [Sphingopyxis sp.]
MIFGGHLDRHYHPGTIVVAEGPVNASSDNFTIEIIGQGAHGARPHESIDAVVVGSLMIMALQTIVSREMNPFSPTVGHGWRIHGGEAMNVITWEGDLRASVQRMFERRTPFQILGKAQRESDGERRYAPLYYQVKKYV